MCGRYLQADLDAFDLRDLKCKFDVILIEPPLEEYYRESGIIASERFWTWDDVSDCLMKWMRFFKGLMWLSNAVLVLCVCVCVCAFL